MNKYEIRKMTPSDVDLLQQISIETFTDTFGKDNSPEHLADYLTQAYALEKLTEELKDKETDFFPSEYRSRACGLPETKYRNESI